MSATTAMMPHTISTPTAAPAGRRHVLDLDDFSRDEIAEVGFVQFPDNGAQEGGIPGLDGAGHLLDKFWPDLPFIIPHRVAVEQRFVGVRNIGIVGHAAPSLV